MCYEMIGESQKWSGYTKKSCKSQCVDHIITVGFIKIKINIFLMNFSRFSLEIQFEIPNEQISIEKICDEFGVMRTMRWYDCDYLILLILKNHI